MFFYVHTHVELIYVPKQDERCLQSTSRSKLAKVHLHLENLSVYRRANHQPIEIGLSRFKLSAGLRKLSLGFLCGIASVSIFLDAQDFLLRQALSKLELVFRFSQRSLCHLHSSLARRQFGSGRARVNAKKRIPCGNPTTNLDVYISDYTADLGSHCN